MVEVVPGKAAAVLESVSEIADGRQLVTVSHQGKYVRSVPLPDTLLHHYDGSL